VISTLTTRNNLIDILEELADAVNICDLTLERFKDQENDDWMVYLIAEHTKLFLDRAGNEILDNVLKFKDQFPQDVERLVDL
jgi:hypothetical protein